MKATADRDYAEPNDRQRRRLSSLVGRLSEDELRTPMYGDWTVAGVLGHMAFWDARNLVLARKLQRGGASSPSDEEPEDVTWLNDAMRPLIDAIAPLEAARLALRVAEETDGIMARLDPTRLWPKDPTSHVNPLRASHRAEHLDEIEAALGGGQSSD